MDDCIAKSTPACLPAQRVRIDEAGRIVIPREVLQALGINEGEELIVALDDDGIRLRTFDMARARVQAIARRRRKGEGSVVDAFLAERRAEAARE